MGNRLAESIAESMLTWSNGLKGWQRDLLRRLAIGEVLSPGNYRMYADVIIENEIANSGPWIVDPAPSFMEAEFTPLAADHLQAEASEQPPVRVTKILHVEGANALAPGAEVTFEPEGLTIVAGRNGSGKSGLTRLLKQVCVSRAPESIVANAFGPKQVPSAVVTYATGDLSAVDVSWTSSALDVSSDLHRVRIFDAHTAVAHLAGSAEVAYVPPVLQILSDYTTALGLIGADIAQSIALNQSDARTWPELNVGILRTIFENIGTSSAKESLANLSELKDDEVAELAVLPEKIREATSSDPAELALQATGRGQQLAVISNKFVAVATELSSSKLDTYFQARNAWRAAKRAADATAEEISRDALLPGAGSAAWKALWAAAEALAAEHEHTIVDFADESGTERCVLCHQELGDEAAHTLHTFREWIESASQTVATEAQRVFESKHKLIAALELETLATETDVTVYSLHDTKAGERLRSIQEDALRLREMVLSESTDDPDLSDNNVHGRLVAISDAMAAAADAEKLAATSYAAVDSSAATVSVLNQKLADLTLRKSLKASLAEVGAEHDRSLRNERLVLAAKQCDSRQASTLNTKLSKEYVAKVANAFKLETQRFKLTKTPVELIFDRTSRGVSFIKVVVAGAPTIPVATVLSEGERRVAAIAGFFADLTESGDTSTLVFDDPVSSLDQEYRDAVAHRLLLESKTRQVLIFSHDNAFVHCLYEQKRAMDTAERAAGGESATTQVHYLHIARTSTGTGVLTDAQHWRHVPIKERISRLHLRIQAAEAIHRAADEIAYEKEAKDIVGSIRETWEAFVEQDLLDGIVMRHERSVHTQKLKRIVDLDATDVATVELGMSIDSTFMTGHAPPISANSTPGDPAWLTAQLMALSDFRKRVNSRRS